MTNIRLLFLASALGFTIVPVMLSIADKTKSLLMVDLKSVDNGMCLPDQTITDSQSYYTCDPTHGGAFCKIVIEEQLYEIHNSSLIANCSNAYRRP